MEILERGLHFDASIMLHWLEMALACKGGQTAGALGRVLTERVAILIEVKVSSRTVVSHQAFCDDIEHDHRA